MKKLFILLVIIFISLNLYSFKDNENSIRAIGMGGAFTGIADDAWSIYYNSAGLWKMSCVEADINYSTEMGVVGLNTINGVFGPVNLFNIVYGAVGFEHFDVNDVLQINTIAMAFSSFINSKIYYGVTFYYSMFKFNNLWDDDILLTDRTLLKYDVSLMFILNRYISIGITGKNINTFLINGNSNEKNDIYPPIYRVGLGYYASRTLLIDFDAEIVNDYNDNINFYIGLEKWVLKILALRIGYKKSDLTFGVGVRYRVVEFDYSFVLNSDIGNTHKAGLKISIF